MYGEEWVKVHVRRTLDGPSDKRLWWLADHRLILADSQNRVVFDSDSQMTGQDLGNDIRVPMVPLLLDDQRIGSLLIAQFDEGLLEQQFLDRVNQGLALAALGTIVIALVAAVLLSRQLTSPIRRLTAAAQGIAAGRLDQRVSVSSRDEVGQLAASFNEMAGKLQLGETQRRRMLADIAHELRNPLSAIQGNLEGMLDGVLPAEAGPGGYCLRSNSDPFATRRRPALAVLGRGSTAASGEIRDRCWASCTERRR